MQTVCVHIYYGDGKGKTTAAVGLALRAKGAGMKVKFMQFLKGLPSSEVTMLINAGIEVVRTPCVVGFYPFMNDAEKRECEEAQRACILEAISTLQSKQHQMLILDEALDLVSLGIASEQEMEALADMHSCAEIIFTGHTTWPGICEKADYISEIKSIKNPYDKGQKARCGIEF